MNLIIKKHISDPFEIQLQVFKEKNEWRILLFNNSIAYGYGYIVHSGNNEIIAGCRFDRLTDRSNVELEEIFIKEELKHKNWIDTI